MYNIKILIIKYDFFCSIAYYSINTGVSGNGMTNLTRRILKITATILTAFFALVTLFIVFTFINTSSYSYNSEGRYFDENSLTVYHEQAVPVYGLLSFIGIALTLLAIYKTRKTFYK